MELLIKALIEAEKSFGKIEMNKIGQVGNHKFKYADLTSIFNATKPALRDNGLKVIGTLAIDEQGCNVLHMTLYHISGQSITSSIKLSSNLSKSTEVGSVLTYMRRYLYSTLLGVVPDEDVDGDTLDECEKTSEKTSEISQSEIDHILHLLSKVPQYEEEIEEFLSKKGMNNWKNVPKNLYKIILENTKKKISEKGTE